jgi:hypothetical protein
LALVTVLVLSLLV